MPDQTRRSGRWPPWDFEPRDLGKIYSDEAIDSLAGDHEIPDANTLKKTLERAAHIYWDVQQSLEVAPARAARTAALKRIRSEAKQIHEHLLALDRFTAYSLYQVDLRAGSFASKQLSRMVYDEPHETTTPWGHKLALRRFDKGDGTVSRQSLDDVEEALRVLEAYCRDAIANIPSESPGPRPKDALDLWALNIHRYWTETLSRQFTIDFHRNEPTSPAARFCVEAFRVFDLEMPATRIRTAMRRAQS